MQRRQNDDDLDTHRDGRGSADRYDGVEAMFFSDQVRIPEMTGLCGLSVTVDERRD